MSVTRRPSLPLTALRTAIVVFAVSAAVGVRLPTASAAPTSVATCQTLSAPGTYSLIADLAVVDATCLTINASDVTLNLAGHTISCTGSGFGDSCQVPAAVAATGVRITPNLDGVAILGPGTIRGFDTGVAIQDSDVLIQRVSFTGPACDPASCSRPFSTGIIALGQSGMNLSRNDVSHHAVGLRIDAVRCPGEAVGCVLGSNMVHDNSCQGILLVASSGYTLTRNVARFNGAIPCFPRGGITLAFGSTANTITNNDSSSNNGFGIRTGFGNGVGGSTSGNQIINNTARGNALADVSQVDGENHWNDNNRCNTADGTVPSSVCDPGE